MEKHEKILDLIPKEYHSLVTNSGMYFDRNGKRFDIEACFDDRGLNPKEIAISLFNRNRRKDENFNQTEIDFNAKMIAINFKTILTVALGWDS